MSKKLTPSQHKALKTITEHYDHGTPLDYSGLGTAIYNGRRGTNGALSRSVNQLTEAGLIGEQRETEKTIGLKYVPTDAGREALTAHAVAESEDAK